MQITNIIITLAWGAGASLLLARILESLIAIIVGLHGLLQRRWKQLVNKASPGQIRYPVLLKFLARMSLELLLCSYLLQLLLQLSMRSLFPGGGTADLLFSAIALLGVVAQFPYTRQRLKVAWKITHLYDFAEKRDRTRLLGR